MRRLRHCVAAVVELSELRIERFHDLRAARLLLERFGTAGSGVDSIKPDVARHLLHLLFRGVIVAGHSP